MYTLIDADAIVPFDDVSAAARLDPAWMEGFFPALMANSRAAGKTWGIPFQRSTILLYWNKAHFRETGLDPERAPANWQEMQGFAQRLTRRENSTAPTSRWGVQIPSSGFPYWLFQGLATANGARLMNPSGTQTQFSQPAAVEALQYWLDLARIHKVHPPGVVAWGSTPRDFREQKVSMIWTTSGNLGALKTDAGFDFGVAKLPAKIRRGSPTGGGNLYLFAKRPQAQREAALELARWLVTPERTAQWGHDSGYIAVRPAAWETPLLKKQVAEFPAATVARDQLHDAVAELSTHENQRVTRVLNGALVAALEGRKTRSRRSPMRSRRRAHPPAVPALRDKRATTRWRPLPTRTRAAPEGAPGARRAPSSFVRCACSAPCCRCRAAIALALVCGGARAARDRGVLKEDFDQRVNDAVNIFASGCRVMSRCCAR